MHAFRLDPGRHDAVIFDLDGVVTKTAQVHAGAWKALFDGFLRARADRDGSAFEPFDAVRDYREHVDGKPRLAGVVDFLASRGISLPTGAPDDPEGAETAHALGRRKNAHFQAELAEHGVAVYPSTLRLIRHLRAIGVRTAIVSSSRNCRAVLAAAGAGGLFDAAVDGVEAARLGLAGKPSPDTFVEAARRLGVEPARAVVVEDAVAGVAAGRAGGFGCVIGVDRGDAAERLAAAGADVVVTDLVQVLLAEESGGSPAAADGRPSASRPRDDAAAHWTLRYDGYDPPRERLREALCALGNGYVVTRGAAAESTGGGAHYPGTYLAGGYDRAVTEIAGREVENEDLVNMPNWLLLQFRIDGGRWFTPDDAELTAYVQRLDLRCGVLHRSLRFRDDAGRETEVTSRRIVSMADPHLAATETTVVATNWSGRIEFRSAIDGTVVNAGVERYARLNGRHLEPVETAAVGDDAVHLKVRTVQSRLEVALSARTRVQRGGVAVDPPRRVEERPGFVAQVFDVDVAAGDTVRVEKVVALYTGRDRAISECGLESRDAVRRAPGFDALLDDHAAAWDRLWQRFDIRIGCGSGDGDGETRTIVHLHVFHLLQTTSPHTIPLDVGVPARGWHGEAYRGHVFWDELFIFPLLNFHVPEITRSLLAYRWQRLREARAAARQAGFRGAMFPWQSGSNGREESQVVHLNPRSGRWIPDETHLQRHVNAAVAYNVWQYHEVTCDSGFMHGPGAEMFLEIARFFSSLATYSDVHRRYEILGVVGPDEYHTRLPGRDEPGLDNNGYTNVTAAWLLGEAVELIDHLPADRRDTLTRDLGIDEAEIERWRDIACRMRVVFHDDGLVSQFEGYEALAEFDWDGYRRRYGDIHRLDRILESEGDDVNRYKVSKQADVLMLFYLFSSQTLTRLFERLGYAFDAETAIPRHIAYYGQRTSHGSTLSHVIHSWVAARSDRERSWELFTTALRSDVDDLQGGTTPEGIHLGAMAGMVDLLERGYTGLELRRDALHFSPALPGPLATLEIRLHYRGHTLTVAVDDEWLAIHSAAADVAPIRVGCRGVVDDLHAGGELRFDLRHGSGSG